MGIYLPKDVVTADVTLSDYVQSRNYCQSLFNIGTMVQGTFSEAAGELALKSPVQDDRFI